MGYVITGIVSVIAGMLVFLLQSQIKENRRLVKEREDAKEQKDTALENGVRQLLSVRLEEMYDKYAESDSIPRRAHSRWCKLHAAYKGLHGNGTFDHMHQEMNGKHII